MYACMYVGTLDGILVSGVLEVRGTNIQVLHESLSKPLSTKKPCTDHVGFPS